MLEFVNKWLKGRRRKEIAPVTMDGCIFSIVSIEPEKEIHCMKDCYLGEKTTCNRHWPYDIKNGKIIATQVVLNVIVTEVGVNGWQVDDGDLKALDESGFSYDGFVLCNQIKNDTPHTNEGGFIHPHTQTNIIYLFNIPKGRKIGGFLMTNRSESVRFEFGEDAENKVFSKEFYNTLQKRLSPSTQENEWSEGCHRGQRISAIQEYELDKLKDGINYIKLQIHKRLNNDMLSFEQKKIEEKIENKAYEIRLNIESKGWDTCFEADGIVSDFYRTLEEYEREISVRRESDNKREIKMQRVSELLNISPYEFEQVCAKIIEDNGYENVRVTPQSNDKGIDILCEKDGFKYAVQCKRYSKPVGSPDMQKFIGAMQNARVNKGILITTSHFTKEAQIMAEGNDIELVDRLKLSEWIPTEIDYV